MRSARKFEVIPYKVGEKTWCAVKFGNGTLWVPSFEDLYHVIKAIVACERAKYSNVLTWDAADMVKDFLNRCCDDTTWEDVRNEFNIPARL